MSWIQKQIRLKPRVRGFHLVTDEILDHIPELQGVRVGHLHLFLQHSSASLTLNENADPSVRKDMEGAFNRLAPENHPDYTHIFEGPDDMPAHIKSSLLGASVQIPISNGKLNLGIWQGIYLCEHRNYGGGRQVVITAFGH